MKLSALLFSLFFSSLYSYADVTGSEAVEAGSRPVLRARVGDMRIVSFAEQASEVLNINEDYRFVVPESGDLKVMCTGSDQYFNSNGTLGAKGIILKRELTSTEGARSTPMKHLFFRNRFPDMDNMCNGFDSFSDDQKLNFWIWYFASIARTESECGRNAYNPNDVNGVSAGELQLPEAWRHRKWRGLTHVGRITSDEQAAGCDATSPRQSVPSDRYGNSPAIRMGHIENNLSCGVEILAGVLCGFYRNPTERCNSTTTRPYGNGFWAEIRAGINGKIIKNVRKFPLCR